MKRLPHSGGVDGGGTVTRTRKATGEALHVPGRNPRRETDPITDDTGKWIGGVRVAGGLSVDVAQDGSEESGVHGGVHNPRTVEHSSYSS